MRIEILTYSALANPILSSADTNRHITTGKDGYIAALHVRGKCILGRIKKKGKARCNQLCVLIDIAIHQ